MSKRMFASKEKKEKEIVEAEEIIENKPKKSFYAELFEVVLYIIVSFYALIIHNLCFYVETYVFGC